MNDLDLCLEVVHGHINHCDVNFSKTTWARNSKFGTRLRIGNAYRGEQIIFLKSERGLGHVTPTIFGIRSNISSKLLELCDFKFGTRLCLTTAMWLSGSAYCSLLWGSTVGYSSDSLASCYMTAFRQKTAYIPYGAASLSLRQPIVLITLVLIHLILHYTSPFSVSVANVTILILHYYLLQVQFFSIDYWFSRQSSLPYME